MKLNDDINKKHALYIVFCFVLVVISIILYLFVILPSIKEQSELKNELEIEINKANELIMNNTEEDNSDFEIMHDNKIYDSYYHSIVGIISDYELDYMSLNNNFPESGSKNFYPMIVEGKVELGNVNNLMLFKKPLNHRLIEFGYNKEDEELKFKNLFLFDKSYSHKNIEIDNRKSADSDDESDDDSELSENNSNNTNDTKEIAENNTIQKSIFRIIDRFDNINLTPMHENLILDSKKQRAPIIDKDTIIINAVNRSNNDAVCFLDFSKLNFKVFSSDLDLYINDYFYDNKAVKQLYCRDNNGMYYDFYGEEKDGKTIFDIDSNIQYPLEILGIKYKIKENDSATFAVMDLGYEIDKKDYQNFIKNGQFATVLKYKNIGIDDFIKELGGRINKNEFINDNSLTKESFDNARILLVRFRELYEIK